MSLAVKVQVNTSAVDSQLTALDFSMRAAARAKDGRLWICFARSADRNLIAAYSDDGGATWTEEVAATGNNRYSVTLMIDSDDVARLIYSFDAANDEVRYVTRSGGSWGAPVTVHTAVGGIVGEGVRACLDTDDNIHVFFREVIAGDDLHYYKRTEGVGWGAREVVDTSGFIGDIAADSAGKVYAVFHDSVTGLYYLRIRNGSWAAREQISANVTVLSTRDHASVAIDNSDDLHVAFIEEGYAPATPDLQVRYRKRQAGSWQTNLQIKIPATNKDCHAPILLLDTQGDAYVIYQEASTSTDEMVYYKKVISNVAQDEVTLDSSIERPGGHPSLYAAFWQKYNGDSVLTQDVSPAVVLLDDSTGTDLLYFEAPAFLIAGAGSGVTWAVKVDWNNDGDFTDADENITSDVKEMRWGQGVEEELEHVGTGTLELVVRNDTGKYSPENTGSALSPNVLPGRPIQVSAIFQSVPYAKFTGTIEKYIPHPDKDSQDCYIYCENGMGQLKRVEIEAPSGGTFTSKKLGDDPGPVETVLDEAGWSATARTLDTGIDTLDIWWVHKQKALESIRDLMEAEKALAYVDGAGKFVYEDRHHRLKGAHLTSQGTFTGTMVGMDYEFSARSVRNIAVIKGHQRNAKTVAYVWGTQDRPSIAAGSSIDIWADLKNPVTGIVEPVANTDWKANTINDGSGDDKTASVSISSTNYGQAVKLTLTNSTSPAVTVFIIPGTSDPDDTLRIQAQEYDDDPVMARESDSTSITAYGDRAISLDIPFKGADDDLRNYATWLTGRFKDPQPDNVRMHLINASNALTTQMLAREISDRITVTVTALGISSKDYFINKVEHAVDQGNTRHRAVFTLGRVEEEAFWVLGQAGNSELGQTTKLVF